MGYICPILPPGGSFKGPSAQNCQQGALRGLSAQFIHQGASPALSVQIGHQGAIKGPSTQFWHQGALQALSAQIGHQGALRGPSSQLCHQGAITAGNVSLNDKTDQSKRTKQYRTVSKVHQTAFFRLSGSACQHTRMPQWVYYHLFNFISR